MGNSWTKNEKEIQSGINGPAALKLASQKIVEFSGKIDEWQRWKNRTKCAFIGSGYESILLNPFEAAGQPSANAIVYSQLAVATSGGTAYHLVKAFEWEQDGNAAWRNLLEWYDGDALKNETADTLRRKLESYRLSSSDGVLRYINNFITTYRELDEVPGEGWSPSHALSVFLDGITDPSFETFVMIQRSKGETLDETILALRKYDRELSAKRVEKRKLKSTVRRMIENNEISIDYDNDEELEPSNKRVKRARRTNVDRKYFNGPNGLKYWFSDGGYLRIDPKSFKELSGEDRQFVISYNAKVRHHKLIDELKWTPTFECIKKESSKEGSSLEKVKKSQDQNHRKRRITFNLGKDDESESEE